MKAHTYGEEMDRSKRKSLEAGNFQAKRETRS